MMDFAGISFDWIGICACCAARPIIFNTKLITFSAWIFIQNDWFCIQNDWFCRIIGKTTTGNIGAFEGIIFDDL